MEAGGSLCCGRSGRGSCGGSRVSGEEETHQTSVQGPPGDPVRSGGLPGSIWEQRGGNHLSTSWRPPRRGGSPHLNPGVQVAFLGSPGRVGPLGEQVRRPRGVRDGVADACGAEGSGHAETCHGENRALHIPSASGRPARACLQGEKCPLAINQTRRPLATAWESAETWVWEGTPLMTSLWAR